MASEHVLLVKLDDGAKAPVRKSKGAAGYDLFAVYQAVLEKDKVTPIVTGVSVAIPYGYYGRVAGRSGLSSQGIHVMGGVIDSDYRGPIVVMLLKTEPGSYTIQPGDGVAQLIIEKCEYPEVVIVNSLPLTERGKNGFGSTGK
jgi:dUTP pyrophosphatase